MLSIEEQKKILIQLEPGDRVFVKYHDGNVPCTKVRDDEDNDRMEVYLFNEKPITYRYAALTCEAIRVMEALNETAIEKAVKEIHKDVMKDINKRGIVWK